ncbi:MAG: MATE family efflux transporter [Wenzhouxiangella sp.]|jgi:MATE family multidrug resistance protein|nr:MATE family efflux transporter [Wenzhouxiangella sp.]
MSATSDSPGLGHEVRRTLVLAAPLVIGQLTNFGMNFVDTVMAGRIGKVDLGAIAVGSSIWAAGFLFTLGVLLAVSATVSQLDGAGRPSQAGEFTRQALWLALVLAAGLILLALSAGRVMNALEVEPAVAELAMGYLRAIAWGAPALVLMLTLRFFSEGIGHTRPTMYVGVLGIACNIPLNWMLMFGNLGFPALGAVGAGWATAIVLWLQLFLMIIWIAWRPQYRPFDVFGRFSAPNLREIRALLKVGLPIGFMVLMEGGLFAASALLVGILGALPVAAHQVAMNYTGLVFMVPLGLAGAITVRVGNAIGRGDPAAARRAGLVGIGIALVFAVCSASVILLFPEAIVRLYTTDPEVIVLAASLLLYAAIFQISDGLQVAAAGALRGLKDTRIPMLYSVFAYWMVGMSVGWWLTFRAEWGPAGMWVGILTGLTVAAVLLSARYWRLSGRLVRRS